MTHHGFIFTPGLWIGEGKVVFSASPDHVRFYTRWRVEEEASKAILCAQEVEMSGVEENVINSFRISHINGNHFHIQLENAMLGKVVGKGVIDSKTIAWEFREHSNFEGFEVYELQDNGEYLLHAEYASPEQYRTIIDGRIWQKST